ncbi:beta-mannanase [Paenibacillus sp. GSMTC-2017]|uniref:beta-mannanase n=1 Tax=Paenibacillus sp. GSMTC-2017 TaxID=2794350 RepID=UPI0018D7A346|nr:beta-mannanase [Paenibacillus sp. GSMTC-2017]MBH5318391.1 beta-mannanase [Paenibacillus sp. GSMTC-2017]
MQIKIAEEGTPLITGLTRMLEKDRCTLRWTWPTGVDAVYIRKVALDECEDSREDVNRLKLYTKAEYKANNGYVSRLESARIYRFTVYVLIETKEGSFLLEQPNRGNIIEISAGKAKIYYSVTEKGGLFRKHKSIGIEVNTEVALENDVLCYVKKSGSFPANRDDGVLYPFVVPFSAGKNILPPIEVGKSDYVRLFLTDGRTHGQLYELIAR